MTDLVLLHICIFQMSTADGQQPRSDVIGSPELSLMKGLNTAYVMKQQPLLYVNHS